MSCRRICYVYFNIKIEIIEVIEIILWGVDVMLMLEFDVN